MRIVQADRTSSVRGAVSRQQRRQARLEGFGLLATTLVAALGLWLTYRQQNPALERVAEDLVHATVLNLSAAPAAEDLAPFLTVYPSTAERLFAARVAAQWLQDHGGVTHVGALARVSVPAARVRADRRQTLLNARLAVREGAADVALFTPTDIAAIKPGLAARTPQTYRRRLGIAVSLFFLAFWIPHLVRRLFGTTGDSVLLPAVQLLAGLSMMAMVTVRDPVRDTDAVSSVAVGIALASLVLTVVSFLDFERLRARLSTFGAFSLAVAAATALLIFGSGPGDSGVKINLLGVQPIEPIRILAVLALAAYFSRRWELLREMSSTPGSASVLHGVAVPRWKDLSPMLIIVGTLLVFFFLQRDLGPALVLGCLSLVLYGVARARAALVAAGFAVLVTGFGVGYWLGVPSTVARRVAIWLDPWNNGITGGDQVAHGLWALASGGAWGLGPGLGEGQLIPAGPTDLIVAVLGEELGLVGVVVIAAAYVLVLWRMLRIAARAPGDYTAFLALGCALSLAVPAIVIVGGLLGLLPLTGVVTPFLSLGKSSMICNVAAIAIVMAIGVRSGAVRPAFARQLRVVGWGLTLCAVVLVGRAALVQAWDDEEIALRPTLVQQGDGTIRHQYNRRLLQAARQIPRGTIYDRNGFALATSDATKAATFLARLGSLGMAAAADCPPAPERCYPLAGRGFHVLGDAVEQLNWAAPNSSFVERDQGAVLQGFDDRLRTVERRTASGELKTVLLRDYRELLPLVRHKGDPAHADVKRLLDRPRDVRITVDGTFQALVARALEARIRDAGRTHGAIVVTDAATGELLASASYPWPEFDHLREPSGPVENDRLLDRARYGLYPPGSTFKLMTAAAALSQSPGVPPPTYRCERLPDGRVGARVHGANRPIRDDALDHTPHGEVDLRKGLVVSCNAYFAQLADGIGPQALLDSTAPTQVRLAAPSTADSLRRTLPYAGYGQGEVVASPLRMARAVGAIASDGVIRDASIVYDPDTKAGGVRWISAGNAAFLRGAMREVVTAGTGRALAGHAVPIAGKTGTAEVNDKPSHSWFVGFAPAVGEGRRIAFAVIVEHAGYGGRAAAPLAGDVVTAARATGVIK